MLNVQLVHTHTHTAMEHITNLEYVKTINISSVAVYRTCCAAKAQILRFEEGLH